MKLILAAVLAAGCAAVALPAAAESQWIASIEYSQLQFTQGGPSPGAVTVQSGYRSSHYWGLEGQASFGAVEDKGVNIGDEFSGYATATLPVGSSADVFARGGWGILSANSAGITNADFWAAGVGADLWLSQGFGLRADYTRQFINKRVPDANVYSVGLTRKF